jgi:hydroxypyruvate reductase
MRGAGGEASSRGYQVLSIEEPVVGAARNASAVWAHRVYELARSQPRPLCIVSSGETTVHVTGTGRGGRNQEFALALPPFISSVGPLAALASVGTDGVDGPTDAAGAIVDATTADRAAASGFVPEKYLDNNDSYAFFAALGDLIHTGPTGTNTGDLQIILLA